MYILGIVEGHNSSAALLKDGEIVAVCFEERLSRLKNDFGYPARAIQYCLDQEGLQPENVDHVAMVTANLPLAQVAVKREATFGVEDYLREQDDYWRPTLIEGKSVDYLELFKDKLRLDELAYDLTDLPRDRRAFEAFQKIRWDNIKTKLAKRDDQIVCLNHHLAHSMYAVFTTPECHDKDWLVLVSDGYGDDCSSSVGVWRNNRFEFVAKSPGSGLGRIYRYAVLLLGMRPGVDEHKMMGLAPYAKETHWRSLYEAMKVYLRVNGMVIDYTNPDKDIYFSLKKRLRAGRFDSIAAAVQAFAEDVSAQWTANAVRETGIGNVTCSGGVALNIKVNKIMAELDGVDDLFVGPSGGDESLSLGAAFALWHQLHPDKPVTPLPHTYWGPSYDKARAKKAIEAGLPPDGFKVIEDPTNDLAADLLAQGKVIARAVGRMEYGARALGNRSIMARADDPGTVRLINDQIKRRDFWMPFAPMILAERADDYLINPKGIRSPYMTIGFDATELGKKHLRAALHAADDTMRPQIVTGQENPELYDLLKCFERKTGLGGVLNTSFNLHGEPICCTPEDSLKTFLNSELDGLLLEDWLVLRDRDGS